MILPLTQQVAPLALCRRLKELGAPQQSFLAWSKRTSNGDVRPTLTGAADVYCGKGGVPAFENIAAAYTVAELGALLPAEVIAPGAAREMTSGGYHSLGHEVPYALRTGKADGGTRFPNGAWFAGMIDDVNSPTLVLHMAAGRATEAEARAALLIKLVELGHVKWDGA
jgi:hypothetical protein